MFLFKKIKETLDAEGLYSVRGAIVAILAITASLYFLYTALFGTLPAMIQRSVLLALTMPMVFLLKGLKTENKFQRISTAILAFLSALPFIYMIKVNEELIMRGGIANNMDLIMGVLAIVIIMDACRRQVGNALPIIAGIFILYAFLGPYMPETFMHRGLGVNLLVSSLYLGEEGIFGSPVAVTANFIMVFVIFGAFLSVSGAGDFFADIANALFGFMRGGPAKAATIGSGLMGMISGSAVANVMTVGPITIPLMKHIGYKPEEAGAVEAVASTGGQIMPPIMGAAAFIMAEFLQIPYGQIIIAAAIPAVLYYVSLFFMVDLAAAKGNLMGMPRNQLPKPGPVMKNGWYLMIPVVILIWMLGFAGYSPQKSAFAAVISLFFIAMVKPHTRFNFVKTLKALIHGAIGALEVAAVCACAGIVIGILMRTGLGLSLTGILVDVSHGILPILMILTMICSIILGMGLPTSACYIIVAVLIAPAMIKMGVIPIASHMFAFFFGCLSAITPPVALAAYASASVAQSNPMTTGVRASLFGIGAFIIPFAFVYGNELLMIGEPLNILFAFVTAAFGVYCLAIMVVGWQFTKVPVFFRVLALAAAVLLIVPGWQSWLGLALLAVISAINFISNKKTPKMTIGGGTAHAI